MRLGDFVPAGAPLFRITGAADQVDRSAAISSVELGLERTLDRDMAYGNLLHNCLISPGFGKRAPALDHAPVVSTIRNRAFAAIIFSYASVARSSGIVSIIGRTAALR